MYIQAAPPILVSSLGTRNAFHGNTMRLSWRKGTPNDALLCHYCHFLMGLVDGVLMDFDLGNKVPFRSGPEVNHWLPGWSTIITP